jgi:hypothetical protein
MPKLIFYSSTTGNTKMAPFSHVNNMQQHPELRYQRVTYIPLCVREDEASIPSRPTANTFVEPQQFHVVNNNHILRQVPHFTPRNFIISLQLTLTRACACHVTVPCSRRARSSRMHGNATQRVPVRRKLSGGRVC